MATIKLYLSNNFNNIKEVGTFETMAQLRAEGKKLLKSGASCADNIPAREFCYMSKGNMKFEWIK